MTTITLPNRDELEATLLCEEFGSEHIKEQLLDQLAEAAVTTVRLAITVHSVISQFRLPVKSGGVIRPSAVHLKSMASSVVLSVCRHEPIFMALALKELDELQWDQRTVRVRARELTAKKRG